MAAPLLLTALVAALGASAAGSSAPRVVSAALDPPAVAGRLAELQVLGAARDAPVSGMVVRFAGGDTFGLSSCQVSSARHGSPAPGIAPGSRARLDAPHVFRRAGAERVLVRLDAGGCSPATQSSFQLLAVTATRPGEAPLAPTVLGAPQPDPGLPPLPGIEDLPPVTLPSALLPSALARSAGGRPCHGAGRRVGRSSRAIAKARRLLLCMLNVQRRARGLRPLRANRRLTRAAAGHSLSMVRRRYFSHFQPGGLGLVSRLRRTRYLAGARGWFVGENIGFGRGRPSAPAGLVRSWMRSSPHRATILNGRFAEAGLGIARGVPGHPRARGATYTVDFGARHR